MATSIEQLERKAKISGLSDEEMNMLEFETNKKRRNELEKKTSLDDKEINELESLYSNIDTKSLDYDQTSPTEAVLKNAADELLMGHYPQVAGGIKSVIEDRPYVNARDESIDRLKQLEIEQPYSSMAGKGVGIAGSFLVPGMAATKLMKGASLGTKALIGGAEGLAMMAAQNPGDTKGTVDPIQSEERVRNITENPILSTVAATVPMIGPGARMMKKGEDLAAKAAYDAIGPKKKLFKESVTQSKGSLKSPESVGRFALDESIVSPGSTYEKMYIKASEKMNDTGKKIDSLIKRNEDALNRYLGAKSLSDPEIMDYFRRQFSEKSKPDILNDIADKLKFDRGSEQAVESISKYLDQFLPTEGLGNVLDINQLQTVRVKLNDAIKWSKKEKELPAIQKGFKILRQRIDDALNNEIELSEKVTNSGDKQKLRALRNDYAKSTIISDSALDRWAAGETAKFNPQSAIIGGATAGGIVNQSVGGAAAGAGLALGGAGLYNSLASGRGGSSYANFLESLQNVGRVPVGASRSASMMMRQREPEVEGFPVSQTIKIGPMDYSKQKSLIEQDSSLSIVDRAKRLHLLNKHGRIYLQQ